MYGERALHGVANIITIIVDILLNCHPPCQLSQVNIMLYLSAPMFLIWMKMKHVDMTARQVQTETIDNIIYEGATSNKKEIEGGTHYTNGDFQIDTHVYEYI